MKRVPIWNRSGRGLAVIAASSFVVIAAAGGCQPDVSRVAESANIGGSAGKGYECQTTRPISPAAAWPVPHDAERAGSDSYTKVVRQGTATRKPQLGAGHVVVLCVTYYKRDGSVREHDPSAIVELDPGPSRWCDVAALMTEGEIRRVWMPDKESPGGMMIADFEMQPWPNVVR